MHDIQNEVDERGIGIDQVGVAGLRYPIRFDDGSLQQEGIAEVAVTVRLQHDRRGTHMSRLIALVHDHLRQFDPYRLPAILKTGADLLDAPAMTVSVRMPISTVVAAPATGAESWLVHDVDIEAQLDAGTVSVATTVATEVTSLCPCSKAISDYGAHNQRSRLALTVLGGGDDIYPLTVSDMVGMLTGSGSAPVVPLVKRPDERVLTMQAFDRPVFVEDIAREISLRCRQRALPHRLYIRNLESIHSHDAVASLQWGHDLKTH
ncbi:GTP cyclohydrolase I FolE2 [Catenulispora pinisilvae]|uniref:GTP cyclohydrolase I FolE2 n=1 Tax=Catenulispora pinisilvae TaxID=2705253 RepID=UPI00189136C0|nr:GTP cyclohydrolase I FolE2 [Catenulispora pinisilvae]